MAKILVVEDDTAVSAAITELLKSQRHIPEAVFDGTDAAEMLRAFNYDLVILDWELPSQSGLDICKGFRSRGGQTPVLMLTGKGTFLDKEAGLDSGADDYLVKPFDSKEFLARVRALLRRPPSFNGTVLGARHISLDPSNYRVTSSGKDLVLLPREYALLEFLLRNKNQIYSNEALIEHVWASQANITADAVRQCVTRLRRKVDLEGQPSLIRTVVGFGYVLED